MKKNIVKVIALLMLVVFPLNVLAEEKKYEIDNLDEVLTNEGIEHDLAGYMETDNQATIYLFYGHGCSYCGRFLTFINSIVDEYGDYFKVEAYETWNNTDNAALMKKAAKTLNTSADGVPFIVIGDKTFNGYAEDYNEDIKTAIMDLYNSEDRYDVMDHIDEKSNDGVIVAVIFGVLIIGVSGLVIFSRKIN